MQLELVLTIELDRSRVELVWTTTELQSTKEEVDNLKQERVEVKCSPYPREEIQDVHRIYCFSSAYLNPYICTTFSAPGDLARER
jgi:hypothetical protein